MIKCKIISTGTYFGGEKISTNDLVEKFLPELNAQTIIEKTGIESRYWNRDMKPSEAGAIALDQALSNAKMKSNELSQVIFATSGGGDFIVPATANMVMKRLGISKTASGYDINHACMGFLIGLDIASRACATGSGPIALVCVENLSQFVGAEQYRPMVVFADGAQATIITQGERTGILASFFANDPEAIHTVTLQHQHYTGQKELLTFGISNAEIKAQAKETFIFAVNDVLRQTGMDYQDLDWVVCHQPNAHLLQYLIDETGIPEEKFLKVVHEVGSIASVSMPYSLHRLRETGKVQEGDVILFAGIGAGVSYGAMLYQN